MTLDELIERINEHYPDGMILHYYDRKNRGVAEGRFGDSLAYSIVSNICDTFNSTLSDEEQLDEARRTLNPMVRELQEIIDNI